MKKTFKKVLLMVTTWMVVMFIASYEAASITKKEYERQIQIANAAREQVVLNLNMIKIAVQTEDDGMYGENVESMKEQARILEDLSYLKLRQSGYLARLNGYIETLEAKREIVSATKTLSEKVNEVKEYLSTNYSKSQTATREKVREAKTKFEEIKIDLKYGNSVQEAVNNVNDILNRLIEASMSVSDCIDTCYKDKIEKINNEYKALISSLAPKDSKKGINLKDVFEKGRIPRSIKNTKKQFESEVKDFRSAIVDDINNLSSIYKADALKDATKTLNSDIQGKYKKDLLRQLNNIYEDYKREVKSAIFEYIDNLTIDEVDNEKIKNELGDAIDEQPIELDTIEIEEASVDAKIDQYISIGIFKKFGSFFGLGGNRNRDFEELKERVKKEFLGKIDKRALKETVYKQLDDANKQLKDTVTNSFEGSSDYNKDIKKLNSDREKLISKLKDLKSSLDEEQRNH